MPLPALVGSVSTFAVWVAEMWRRSVLSAAYLVMRSIKPRPPRSDLIRQPGALFLGLTITLMILFMIECQFVSMETMETWAKYTSAYSWEAADPASGVTPAADVHPDRATERPPTYHRRASECKPR